MKAFPALFMVENSRNSIKIKLLDCEYNAFSGYALYKTHVVVCLLNSNFKRRQRHLLKNAGPCPSINVSTSHRVYYIACATTLLHYDNPSYDPMAKKAWLLGYFNSKTEFFLTKRCEVVTINRFATTHTINYTIKLDQCS